MLQASIVKSRILSCLRSGVARRAIGGYKWKSLETSLYFVPNAMLSLFSGFFPHFICGSIRRSAAAMATQFSRHIFKD
jgi:hypothetical protein